MRLFALIVAAGSGTRAGGPVPKQYQLLGGKPILRHTVERFIQHPDVENVMVVIQPDQEKYYASATQDLTLLPWVKGGSTRQESVKNGLEALATLPQAPTHVLIHDAARCFTDQTIITRVCDALKEGEDAVIPAVTVTDTVKQVDKDYVQHTLPRGNLIHVQTPQGFTFEKILTAHQHTTLAEAPDDAAIAEQAGIKVRTVTGHVANRKITTQDDLAMNVPSANFEPRTAMGYDVHRLVAFEDHIAEEARTITLGGLSLPHSHYLEGHSDADVVLHAITDALLGTIADGDIGSHFSPHDPRWKGANSAMFLAEALLRVQAASGNLRHVDVTVIAERPKISPHRDAMREHIAQLLRLPVSRVSIKATTTEGLGFTGRREGIAAQAIATVMFPSEDH